MSISVLGGHHGWRSTSSSPFVRGGEPIPRTRRMIVYHVVCIARRPRGSTPIADPGSGHAGKKNESIRRCYLYARKSASQAVLSRMPLILHATRPTHHNASHLVQAMSACLMKTRRALSRHSRGARVCYGHTATAMHDMITPPPSPYFTPPIRGTA